MFKNYTLHLVAVLSALIGTHIQAGDWFEGMRSSENQAVNDNGRPVGVIFEEVETESGDDALRLKPVEGALGTIGGIFGGNRRDNRDMNNRNHRQRNYDEYKNKE